MTASARWWFVGDLHLDPGLPGAVATADAFRRFTSSVVLAKPSAADHLVLLGDTFELRSPGTAAGRGSGTALRAALRAFPSARDALGESVEAGVRVHLVCGNHDYPLMSSACRRVLDDELAPAAARGMSVHPWLLYAPGMFYAEHGHQHHELNRIPHQLLAHESPDGRLAPTVLESWGLVRGTGGLTAARGLARAALSTRRAERRARSRDYEQLLSAAAGGMDGRLARALHDTSRFEMFRAGGRTACRVAARQLGRGDHYGYLRAAADRIDAIFAGSSASTPGCYVFGHTHVESLAPLRRRGAWYANTGTWASHGRDRHVDPRRLPFLSVERDLTAGTPDLVQLRYWDDTALMATVARTVELRRS